MSADDKNHSSRRINFLAKHLGAKNYLEVGVCRGHTFLRVDIPRKIAVDPNFQFDFKPHGKDQVEFIQETSDEYFLKKVGAEQFDIIFLDGLHKFEQTFRDFANATAHGHRDTIWIIDDTVPIDVYSSLPEQRDARRFRKECAPGEFKPAWHGDVYKVVFAIHDFFPAYSYATIHDQGNPQTVVWQRPRENFAPLFNDFEKISRLDFFDMKKHAQVFNYASEKDVLDLAVRSLKPKQA